MRCKAWEKGGTASRLGLSGKDDICGDAMLFIAMKREPADSIRNPTRFTGLRSATNARSANCKNNSALKFLHSVLILLFALVPDPGRAGEISVSSRAELVRTLADAGGGETLVLADGNYGSLHVEGRRFPREVTIRSAGHRGARFDEIVFVNSGNIRIDNVHVASPTNGSFTSRIVAVLASRDITVTNSEISGPEDSEFNGHHGIGTDDGSANVTISGNYIHDVKNGGTFISSSGLKVTGNTVDRIGNDAFKFLAVRDVLIEGNTGSRNVFPAPGSHLDFIQFQGGDSEDIIIRGNVFLPGTRTNVQGIFMDDAHYTNVLIERNIIVTAMIRGISVSSGTNVVARYNTVLDVPDPGSKATFVMVDGQAYGNIMGTYPNDRMLGETEGNLFVQLGDPKGPFHYHTVFRNAAIGAGVTLADLEPVPGGLADRYGAAATGE